ncbi:hypothetical protein DN069_28975 [Streptacidiphilus pinicola]|uniref:Uncharacterized protein n=1 Tax=Streptacidiphilus pinicola TaxID=2219663 RepID=A0A2X0IB39_9ACTN|nr:hypothetical protein DN069_28975 [Streptacidiphilus pinicola]
MGLGLRPSSPERCGPRPPRRPLRPAFGGPGCLDPPRAEGGAPQLGSVLSTRKSGRRHRGRERKTRGQRAALGAARPQPRPRDPGPPGPPDGGEARHGARRRWLQPTRGPSSRRA